MSIPLSSQSIRTNKSSNKVMVMLQPKQRFTKGSRVSSLASFFFFVVVEVLYRDSPPPFTSSFTTTSFITPPQKNHYKVYTHHSHLSSLHLSLSLSASNRENEEEQKSHQIFIGKEKWLGGARSNDGTIYGIPSNADCVICLRPTKNAASYQDSDIDDIKYQIHTIPLPKNSYNTSTKYKWLRGIICNDYLYGIPAWSNDGVLRLDLHELWKSYESKEEYDTENDIVSIIPLPEEFYTQKDDRPTRWLWHGAALNSNQTAIYCIPSNAHQVLKVDLNEARCTFLNIPETQSSSPAPSSNESKRQTENTTVATTPLGQTNKWYGGILGNDNCIYGIPYSASNVLRIDANTDKVTLLGDYGLNKYNWHGGVKSKQGAIYCFPSHHSHVLKIDTSRKCSANERLSLVPIQRAVYDNDEVTKYKWLGGSIGANGNIYGMPSDASSILRIDTESDIATTFGVVSKEKNKWQGGCLSQDGTIYAIPSNAQQILCIDTAIPDDGIVSGETKYSFVGNFPAKKDKWQGGFLGLDNSIYCIPENANEVLKVIPRKDSILTEIEFL